MGMCRASRPAGDHREADPRRPAETGGRPAHLIDEPTGAIAELSRVAADREVGPVARNAVGTPVRAVLQLTPKARMFAMPRSETLPHGVGAPGGNAALAMASSACSCLRQRKDARRPRECVHRLARRCCGDRYGHSSELAVCSGATRPAAPAPRTTIRTFGRPRSGRQQGERDSRPRPMRLSHT
jgi:hypothetical protein